MYVWNRYLLEWFNEIDSSALHAVSYFEIASFGNVRKGKKLKWSLGSKLAHKEGMSLNSERHIKCPKRPLFGRK